MAQYKRWPIGLQSGPTGKPDGIGEVIRALTDNNIATFAASSDSMSILFDLQKERKETGVPHTGNYIPTGYVDGFDLSVPEKGVPPSAEAAKRHWDHVEKRGLPPEIDWDLPCIWLSTWNEVRPYLKWSEMGSGAPDEDPVDGFEGNADWMGHWAVEVGKEALNRGYRWAAFGFAGGNPEPGFWEAPGVLEYLRLCEQHPDKLGVALHEYSHVLTILNNPDKIGRFQQLHAVCDKHNIRRPVIQIKEFGWGAHEAPTPDVAINELVQVANMYMAHPNIHGAAIWTVRDWPGDIQQNVQAMIPRLKDTALTYAQPIPSSGPAAPVAAVIEPAVLRPAMPVSSGYVTVDYLNFRSEPNADSGQATVITVLSRGTKLGILSKLANGWLQVKVGGQEGYVAGRYISDAPVAPVAVNGNGFQSGMNVNPDAPHSNPINSGVLEGMNWVRFVFKVDDRINPAQRGNLDSAFAQYDPIVRAYADQGVNSLIILNQETRHASPDDPGIDWPAFCGKFAQTAGKIAEHYNEYGSKVAYEIWNEGDLDNNHYSVYLSPDEYAALLRPTAGAIRAASPGSAIILGGLATGPHASVNYIKQTRAALGGSLPVDAIGIHPYGRYVNQPPFSGWGFGRLSEALDFYRANLPGLKFWITEIGIANDNPLPAENYAAIGGYLTDVFKEVAQGYADLVPVTIWFAWSDVMHNAGIVQSNGEQKAHVFEAFRKIRDREVFA